MMINRKERRLLLQNINNIPKHVRTISDLGHFSRRLFYCSKRSIQLASHYSKNGIQMISALSHSLLLCAVVDGCVWQDLYDLPVQRYMISIEAVSEYVTFTPCLVPLYHTIFYISLHFWFGSVRLS